jgi:hypothetical protein
MDIYDLQHYGLIPNLCKEHLIENVIKLFILKLSQKYDVIELTSSIKNCKIKISWLFR